jgi:GTPase SAR1 family protein
MIAEGKRCLALLEHKKGNFKRALQILEKCLETVEKCGNDVVQLPFLEIMAKVYTDQEKYETALKIY